MSNKILVLLILFSLSLCLKSIEESEVFLRAGNPSYKECKAKIISRLKADYAKLRFNFPSNYKNYVKGFNEFPGVEYNEGLPEITQINSGNYLLPDEIQKFLSSFEHEEQSSVRFTHYKILNFHRGGDNFYENCQINIYIVAALRIENYVMFGIIHSNIRASLTQLFRRVKKSKNVRKWWCLWTCKRKKYYYVNERRNQELHEQQIIQTAIEAKSGSLISKRLKNLK